MSDINFVSKKTMIFIDEKTFCRIGALNFQKLLPKTTKKPPRLKGFESRFLRNPKWLFSRCILILTSTDFFSFRV